MRRVAMLVIGLVVLVAACSSDKKSEPTTSTTTSLATTTTTATTTRTSVPGTTAGTTTPTTTGSSGSSIRVTGLTGPSSPVTCNAETQLIELSWTTSGASNVELRIDNGAPYTYSNGAHTEMLPLKCDGKSHTYKLTATGPGTSASQSITLQTKKR
jgi:hypothetical protein